MKDATGKELLDCNKNIKKLLYSVIPERNDEINKFVDTIKFYVRPDDYGHQMSAWSLSTPPEIGFDNKTLNIIWITAFIYAKLITDQNVNFCLSAIKASLLNDKTTKMLLTLYNKYCQKHPLFKKLEHQINSLLSDCSYEDTKQKDTATLSNKQCEMLFIETSKYIKNLLNESTLSEFEWPSDIIIRPQDHIDSIYDTMAEHIAVIALAYILLHEINHCLEKHQIEGIPDFKRKEEIDCDKFALYFILDKIEEYHKQTNEDSQKVIFKRLLGIIIGFFFIAEVSHRKDDSYPDLRERLFIILEEAEKIIKYNNSHFWISCASFLYMKLKSLNLNTDIKYTTAKDLAFQLAAEFKQC